MSIEGLCLGFDESTKRGRLEGGVSKVNIGA